MTPINLTTLKDAGYNLYKSSLQASINGEAYIGTMQKSFDDDEGKRYNITIDCLDLSMIAGASSTGKGYIATAQFNVLKFGSQSDYTTFNVEQIIDDEVSIEEMEDLFNAIWHSMKCKYYVEWSD